MLEQISPDNLFFAGSTKLHALGEEYCAPQGKKFVYGKYELGAAVTAQAFNLVSLHTSAGNTFDFTTWSADYSDGILADVGYVGVTMAKHPATTSYGWFQIQGAVSIVQEQLKLL